MGGESLDFGRVGTRFGGKRGEGGLGDGGGLLTPHTRFFLSTFFSSSFFLSPCSALSEHRSRLGLF